MAWDRLFFASERLSATYPAPMIRCTILSLSVLILSCPSGRTAQKPLATATIEVAAGKFARDQSLVTVSLDKAFQRPYRLKLTGPDGKRVVTQRWGRNDEQRLTWHLSVPLGAGEKRSFQLAAYPAAEEKAERTPKLVCVDDGSQLILTAGDRPILRYHHAIAESPAGIDPAYRQSGHIHPFYSPGGIEVTDDFPEDHAHQHGIFFPWVNTSFKGRKVDFWNQAKGLGIIEHEKILATRNGGVFSQFTVAKNHQAHTADGKYEPVLNETWQVRAYDFEGYYVVDLESRQRCATKEALEVKEFRYGGMAVRGNYQWYDPDLQDSIRALNKAKAGQGELAALDVLRDYLTSEGKTWVDGNATRARWVTMHGELDGQQTGITVMCHPNNFRAPQHVRLHPSKPYFCFAPMIAGDFEIKPGEVYVSRYRFITRDGEVDAKLMERLWNDYANPPTATVAR